MADKGPLWVWLSGVILFAVLLVVWGGKLAVDQRAREKPLRDSLAYETAWAANRQRWAENREARYDTVYAQMRQYQQGAAAMYSRALQAEGELSWLQQDPNCQVR